MTVAVYSEMATGESEVRDTFEKPGKLVRKLVKCHLVLGNI